MLTPELVDTVQTLVDLNKVIELLLANPGKDVAFRALSVNDASKVVKAVKIGDLKAKTKAGAVEGTRDVFVSLKPDQLF